MISVSTPLIKVTTAQRSSTKPISKRKQVGFLTNDTPSVKLRISPAMVNSGEQVAKPNASPIKPYITMSNFSSEKKKFSISRDQTLKTHISDQSSDLKRYGTPLKVCMGSNLKIFIEEPARATAHLSISTNKTSTKVSTADTLSNTTEANSAVRTRINSIWDDDQLLDHLIQQMGSKNSNLQTPIKDTRQPIFRIVSKGGQKIPKTPKLPASVNLDASNNINKSQITEKQVVSSKNIMTTNESQENLANRVLPKYYMGDLGQLASHFQGGRKAEELESEFLKSFYEHFCSSLQTLRGMSSDTLLDTKEFLKKLEFRQHHRFAEKDISPQTSQLDKPLLVLDLDETLIHKPVQGRIYREDAAFLELKCYVENQHDGRYFTVYKRPYLQEFLQEVSERYTIYVYTASDQRYATAIVNAIDPERLYISRVFDRRFCCATDNGYLVKDLRIFSKEAPLNQILLVDNSSHCFFTQLKNGIPILSFFDEKEDRELLHLKRYLLALCRCENMLAKNEAHFLLEKYFSAGNAEVVLQKICSSKKIPAMLKK
jgi:Dullard-like phosphatase family protein